jgi:hypothetical protein
MSSGGKKRKSGDGEGGGGGKNAEGVGKKAKGSGGGEGKEGKVGKEGRVGKLGKLGKKGKVGATASGGTGAGAGGAGFEVTEEEHSRAVALLRGVQWERVRNTSRRNVIREEGAKFCMSFIFGRNMKDPDGALSYWSIQYPELYSFFNALMKRIHPTHRYTNITVNKNLQCKRHTDGGNTGNSYIVAFGTYTGGRLFVEKRGGGR